MSRLPARRPDQTETSRDLDVGRRASREVALAIHEHALVARLRAEVDMADTQALGDALQFSLDAEIDLFNYGLSRAGASSARAELVARKVEMLSSINNARIRRRFGA